MNDWGAAAPTALLIASAAAVDAAATAIAASGARQLATIDLTHAAAGLDDQPDADALLVETAGTDPELLGAVLEVIADPAARGVAVIVSFPETQLDQVAAAMLGRRAQLLCAPGPADRAAALAVALAGRRGGRLRESDPESETARLRRLNDEVARIADLLARIGHAPQPSGFADRSLALAGERDDSAIAPAEIRRAIRARRLRDQFFGGGLFEDPAWDMLLDLFAADLERARVLVSSLCIAAAVAPTTALRWIGRMSDAGLFEREPDPGDRRRAFLRLSPAARAGMVGYWQALRKLGAAPA